MSSELDALAARLASVSARIAAACIAAGREPSSVQLLAVSKRHSSATIRLAYALGLRELGENYVQELVQKWHELRDLPELRFHAIGHLQRNKVKDVVRAAASVDSVDSERLARALSAQAEAEQRVLDVLIQVNVAAEPQKSGVLPAELPQLMAAVKALPALRVRGFMTIPPASEDPEHSRPHFRRLRELAAEHAVSELSMGMSDDLEVAIAEGATVVRIGTAIFGTRDA